MRWPAAAPVLAALALAFIGLTTWDGVFNTGYRVRLDAVDAYEQKLVKQIEVASATVEQGFNKPYVKLVGIGVMIGLVGALALSRLVTALLFGVAPTDPMVYGGVIFIIGAVALVANLIPAFRATRIDPMVALRTD